MNKLMAAICISVAITTYALMAFKLMDPTIFWVFSAGLNMFAGLWNAFVAHPNNKL